MLTMLIWYGHITLSSPSKHASSTASLPNTRWWEYCTLCMNLRRWIGNFEVSTWMSMNDFVKMQLRRNGIRINILSDSSNNGIWKNYIFLAGYRWKTNMPRIYVGIIIAKLYTGNVQGAVSIRKTVLPGMAIPMLKIRRPTGRLIFNMEIAIRR